MSLSNYTLCFLMTALLLVGAGSARAEARTAAMLRSGLGTEDASSASALTAELRNAGYSVTEVDFDDLCDTGRLKGVDLLVLPDASALPAKAGPAIEAYLAGGDIIALNTPMWQKQLVKAGGKWIDREDYARTHATEPPQHVAFGFASADLSGWQRSSDSPNTATTYETVPNGPGLGQHALRVKIPKVTSWDTYLSPSIVKPFPDGNTLTVFSAKGGPKTNQLLVEWNEKDGSRWMAVIALSREWKQYVLRPEDFRYWQSVPSRGSRGDQLNPGNAERLNVGIALSHCDGVGEGPHEYWIGPIGTSAVTPDIREALWAADPPKLETLSPVYKLFDCHGVARLQVRSDQILVSPTMLPVPKIVRSPHPRGRAAGFDKGRDWRWTPLIEARAKDGQWRGVPATLVTHASGPYKGGQWASFGVGDRDWYRSPEVVKLIGELARRMKSGVFILDGGANLFTYQNGQDVRLGITAANVGTTAANLTASVRVRDLASGREALTKKWSVELAPGETRAVSETWRPAKWTDSGYEVTAELSRDGAVIDSVRQGIHVWRPKQTKRFVTVNNGSFILDGKRWRAHGVNYMPSSGIGTEDWPLFHDYLDARAYDPEVIQRDLDHCKEMGLNAVSVILPPESLETLNLLDLCRRLDKLGMKLNLAMRYGTPMGFAWEKTKYAIDYFKLADNDTVFAYDLAWEPSFGKHDERVMWDGEWEKWVVERYGSIGSAENDWEFPIPRDAAGKVTNPGPKQIDTDGEWKRMTAAYRRFLDFLLYKKYGAARRLVKSVDPNHLVSFRMSEIADPTYRDDGFMAYDFPYLAAGVDFLAPEAYGRIGEWERVKPGVFQTVYARWAAPKEPVIWAESGMSIWDKPRGKESLQLLKKAADGYANMYRLLAETRADGIFHWFYSGGFRTDEGSDFGIINPDGTDREVTRVIRRNAREFLSMPEPKAPDYYIEIDRDAHPDGIAGIYDEKKAEFWQAIKDGRTVGLKTAGTGKTSADCPMLAVGNTPWQTTNPAKYLDAAIDSVKIQDADGKWVEATKGQTVKVPRGATVLARVEFTNLGEASLVPPSPPGALGGAAVIADGPERITVGLSETPHLGSGVAEQLVLARSVERPTRVTITFGLGNGFTFGEKFDLTLVPQAD